MSWTTTKDQGSGTLAYRLAIHGCPVGFVTHTSMVKPAATPPRIGGLSVTSGKLKCIANIASGELDVSGLSCTIADLAGQASAVFGRQPSLRTWLTANVTSAATACTVRSTAGFGASGSLWLDSEAMTYSAKSAGGFRGMTRGALSTLAQNHYVDAGGSLRFPEITNLPVTYAGRRATLHVYGEHDDPQGDGTQIWRGIISREPTFRGSEWALSIDPISSVLARAVGADLGEPLTPSGITYTWNRPFVLGLHKSDDGVATPADGVAVNIVFPTASTDTARFSSNDEFVIYLNSKIAASSAGAWDTAIVAVADGDASWHLEATTDGATPTAVFASMPADGIDPVFRYAQDVDGSIVSTFAAGVTYKILPTPDSLPGAGSVPRGYIGDESEGALPGWVNPSLRSVFPGRRIYVGGVASVSSLVTAAAIHFPAYGPDEEREETLLCTANASPRYITIRQNIFARGYTSASLPEIRLGRTYATNGSVWTALSAIIAAGPAELNLGSVADMQSGDFDSSSWDDLDAVSQPRIVRERSFTSFADVPAIELVREELKLAGYALGMSATGTLAIFRLRRPVATEAGAVTIDAFKVSDSMPVWQSSGVGLVNTVKFKRGYEPVEDEHTGATVIVRDVAAYGQSPRPRLVTIEPKSKPTDGQESQAEVVEVAARLFSLLAYPYATVQGDVGLRHFDTALPGAAATVTSPHLPDVTDGSRGVTAIPMLITGREMVLRSGRISLTLYAPLGRATGYAPEAKLTANSNVSGNTYDLTCDTYTFASGTTAATWFIVGDRVRVWRWDSTTAGTLVGTVVTGGASNVVRVTFDGAWTPGADTWILGYAVSTDASLATTQLEYAYMAGSTGRIDAATDIDAWGFA